MLAGTNEVVPTFTLEPFDGVGAQLCPCNLATANRSDKPWYRSVGR